MTPTLVSQHSDLIGYLVVDLLLPACFGAVMLAIYRLDARQSPSNRRSRGRADERIAQRHAASLPPFPH